MKKAASNETAETRKAPRNAELWLVDMEKRPGGRSVNFF